MIRLNVLDAIGDNFIRYVMADRELISAYNHCDLLLKGRLIAAERRIIERTRKRYVKEIVRRRLSEPVKTA